MVLLGEAANFRNFRYSGDSFQVVLQVPILIGTELGQAVAAGIILQNVLEDPAQSRRVRTDFRLHAFGQTLAHAGKVLHGAGTRPVDVGSLFEDYVNEREAEVGDAADGLHLGRAGHGRDDGVGDLVFDDVGAAVPAGKDDDLGFAEVGRSVEREMRHRPCAPEASRRDDGQN